MGIPKHPLQLSEGCTQPASLLSQAKGDEPLTWINKNIARLSWAVYKALNTHSLVQNKCLFSHCFATASLEQQGLWDQLGTKCSNAWAWGRGYHLNHHSKSKHLPRTLRTRSLEPMWWEEKTDSCKLSANLHRLTRARTHTWKHTYNKYINVKNVKDKKFCKIERRDLFSMATLGRADKGVQ